jgi:uncharacterized protein (TIGR03643 family)
MESSSAKLQHLTESDVSRIIQMAWEDRTTFETIERSFGINESGVVRLMRRELKKSSFKMWRERMRGRITKHRALRSPAMSYSDRTIANHRRANC